MMVAFKVVEPLDTPQGRKQVLTSQTPRVLSKVGPKKYKALKTQSIEMTIEETLKNVIFKGTTELSHNVKINTAITKRFAHYIYCKKPTKLVGGKFVMVPLSRLHVAFRAMKYKQ